jgi:uncharacterized membrane protein YkvA (DUF1232 family)
MINDFLIEELRDEYDRLVQKMKFRHPTYFDEYKSAMMEIYRDEVKSDKEYWKEFYWMAFKIEIRKGLIYSFLNSEHLDPIRGEIERDSC